LKLLLARLSTAGMRVNASKSKFFAEKYSIGAIGLPDKAFNQYIIRLKPYLRLRLQEPEKKYVSSLV
jgi:hypothetical protein